MGVASELIATQLLAAASRDAQREWLSQSFKTRIVRAVLGCIVAVGVAATVAGFAWDRWRSPFDGGGPAGAYTLEAVGGLAVVGVVLVLVVGFFTRLFESGLERETLSTAFEIGSTDPGVADALANVNGDSWDDVRIRLTRLLGASGEGPGQGSRQ